MDKDILCIASEVSEYKLKKNETRKINIYGATKEDIYLINNNQLIYSVPKEYKQIISVSKNGIITATGKRGNVGYIKITLKENANISCYVSINIK